MEVQDILYVPTNAAGLLVALGVCENLEEAHKLFNLYQIAVGEYEVNSGYDQVTINAGLNSVRIEGVLAVQFRV